MSKKPLNTIQLCYLSDLEKQIDALGRQITEKRKLMLELLKGRRVRSRGQYFEIDTANEYSSGMGGTNIYFKGPTVKKDGSLHRRVTGAAMFRMIEEIE